MLFPFFTHTSLKRGKRCAALNVGPKKTISIKNFNTDSLITQLQEVLVYNTECIDAAKALGQELMKEDGKKVAVQLMRKLFYWMKTKDEPFDDKFGQNETPTNCPVCDVEFGTFTRKHQCRGCGLVACATCLTPKVPLMNYADDQYLCKTCKERAGNDGKVAVMKLAE